MSLNIQTTVAMPQNNNLAFKGKEKLLQKVKRNILFSPEQQQRIREIMQSDYDKEIKRALLVNEAVACPNIFANLAANIKRIFSK